VKKEFNNSHNLDLIGDDNKLNKENDKID